MVTRLRRACSVPSPCFDTTRCGGPHGGAIRVFVYPPTRMSASDWLQSVIGGRPAPDRCRYGQTGASPQDLLRWLRELATDSRDLGIALTTNPSEACLLLATCGDTNQAAETRCWEPFERARSWRGGANHFIWRSNWCHHADQPLDMSSRFDSGMAALGSSSLLPEQALPRFDIPLFLRPGVTLTAEERARATDRLRRRPLLLSFRGTVHGWAQSGWQPRWLAVEYIHDPAIGVVVEVLCDRPKGEKPRPSPLAASTRESYVGLLLNSTFAFTPGGGGPHSYRFGEALAAGAIPVVPSNLLLPFEPEISWAECAVRVKDEDIVDLPRLLATRSLKEVQAMRAACARLFDEVVGTDDRPAFRLSVRLWVARLRATAGAHTSRVGQLSSVRLGTSTSRRGNTTLSPTPSHQGGGSHVL